MTILVTGALGFIGSNLVPKLLNLGHIVVGVDNLVNPSLEHHKRIKRESGKNFGRFFSYNVDINNDVGMRTIAARHQPDAIVHLAAVGSVPRSFALPHQTAYANEYGFASVMELARDFNIKKFIYASSSSVYGSNPDPVKIEGLEGMPLSPYALSKKMNEEFAKIFGFHNGITTVGLRFFNVYGPGQSFVSAYAAVIPKFLTSAAPVVYGDGSAVRDFTFVEDATYAICLALDHEKSIIVNVGSGEGTSIAGLLFALGKHKDATFSEVRPGDIGISVASIDRARDEMGFLRTHLLEEGLRKTRDFYRGL